MICRYCKGSGTCGLYDGESVACTFCEGIGHKSRLDDTRFRLSMVSADLKDRFLNTRLGVWWWRQFGVYRKAKRYARGRTFLEVSAHHGHHLHRLRAFATAIEAGADIQRVYRREKRIGEALSIACKIVSSRERYTVEV